MLQKTGKKEVNVDYTSRLIEDTSLGGIRFLSSLHLPVVSELNYKFEFEMMGKSFNPFGKLVYKKEEKQNIYSYGVSFDISEKERDRLANMMNQISVLKKLNQDIPDTDFIYEHPSVYLQKTQRN